MDSQRLRFVATGLAWVVGFAVAFGTLVTLLGGGLSGVGVSLVVSLGAALGLYLLWPRMAKQTQGPLRKKASALSIPLPAPKTTTTKKTGPTSPSRVRVCDPGPYRVKPGIHTKVQLDVKEGDNLEGHLVEKDSWDFDWWIVDQINLVRYINEDPKLDPLDEGDHQAAYDIKCTVPHDGLWYLLLDLYQRQNYRDVEVNLFRAA
jgi:hypothetical protein